MFEPRNQPQKAEPPVEGRRRIKRQAGESRKKKNPDEDWVDSAERNAIADTHTRAQTFKKFLLAAFLIAAGIGLIKLVASKREAAPITKSTPESYYASPSAIHDFAKSFAYDTAREHRLSLSRNPEETAKHLPHFLPGGLDGKVESLRMLGRQEYVKPPRTGFVATLENGEQRLLAVVETGNSLKVDWDAYARYCTTPWGDLFDGTSQSSDARVFVALDEFYPEPYGEEEWASFTLTSPDVSTPMYGFVRRTDPLGASLLKLTTNAPPIGSRAFLRIKRTGGSEKRHLFEIERMIHNHWILPD